MKNVKSEACLRTVTNVVVLKAALTQLPVRLRNFCLPLSWLHMGAPSHPRQLSGIPPREYDKGHSH